MKKLKTLALSAFACFVIASCGKDEDNQPADNTRPVIETAAINEKTSGAVINAGSEAHLELHFSDDRELGEARIDIHNDFDGHSHGRLSATPFAWQKIIDLNGQKEFTGHEHIEIPENAASGLYHLTIILTDKAGNEADVFSTDFEIASVGQPEIAIISPDLNTETDAAAGTSFQLTGSITDATDLAEIHIQLVEAQHDHGRVANINNEPLFEKEINLPGSSDTSYSLNETIAIPATATAGHYNLIIKARDNDNNYTIKSGEIHID